MKLTITNMLSGFLMVSSLAGCGAFSNETEIEIQMYGIAQAPATATGDHDPQFQTYEVLSITLNGDESASLIDSSSSFKIVDRPQILVARNVKSYIGKAYTGMTVVFAPTVTGGDREEGELTFSLTEPTLTLSQAISFEEGKNQTYLIKAAWENTMGAGVMTEPTLEISRQ